MNTDQLAQQIGRQITWMNSWKQPKGYGGPVIHYWKDSINYTGVGRDWRYEGIITGFVQLYKKTGQKEFLQKAIEASNHVVNGQLRQGQYNNSGFDGNPSGPVGSMPHDTAASIGLMQLAQVLQAQKNQLWKRYVTVVQKNLEFHMKCLYDKKTSLFLQTFPSLDHRRHYVANKHATLAELFVLFYKVNKNKKYLQLAERCAQFVMAQQDHKGVKGGIHQTDKNPIIISLYNARCISGLMVVYEATKKSEYAESAVEGAEFLKKMAAPNGGFYFGVKKRESDWKIQKYPQFIGGAGDMIRALLLVNKYKKKYSVEEHMEWIKKYTHCHGGVWTSRGMHLKNETDGKEAKEPCWRDVVPVMGWNDKTLRVLVELLKEGKTIEPQEFMPAEVQCNDGMYEEDENTVTITTDKKRICLQKKKEFYKLCLMQALLAMKAERVLPPYVWEKLRRLNQKQSGL